MNALGPRETSQGRHESPEERADRRWNDLLQEVRVIQTGVQILFGFLLTVVFTPRFATLGQTDQTIYVVTVLLGAATTGALIGTVTFHRLVTGHRLKPETVLWASRLSMVGIVLLLATVASALLLILRIAMDDSAVPWIVSGLVGWFILCWFALPTWVLRRSSARE
ncbi:DUF6328 family protein [Streptomyces libani]|uniref:DUF6328 family protein n=2 Tax=Streptomyces nigrescens TaxID=1920 RepID=A0A640TTF1_STRNI|nr:MULTISPECIES: DUF6328 family protein [Streptomyces]MCX5445330.1 DUF6328 family protein [Streptomyces libani]WAU00815.1 DUF6328 family protein [Streptomyces libani subsp. libani]WAU08678.1 DUF6328 family protein [Streptomyces nigrescens]WDT53336.1 DUF6328 family protein [Streptomyces sp. G7(2002)]GFE26689.1 hypothetical protein Sliba_71420 [Streptomyces libani subsp. libani]